MELKLSNRSLRTVWIEKEAVMLVSTLADNHMLDIEEQTNIRFISIVSGIYDVYLIQDLRTVNKRARSNVKTLAVFALFANEIAVGKHIKGRPLIDLNK